ncbi:DUF4351 domain-containing protein [Ectothiorhodospiraceae bacterium BW-2]|nr:DUF4351 domain-containing protein [Ectothiorhodospiraceae bacterium BW-2]
MSLSGQWIAGFVGAGFKCHEPDLSEEERPEGVHIYLLFDHKSTPDRWVALQLLRYQVLSAEAYRKQNPKAKYLPPVYPIVLYHGQSRWNIARDYQALIRPLPAALTPYIPQFHYDLHDISPHGKLELKGEVLTRMASLALRYIYDKQPLQRLLELIDLIRQIQDRATAVDVLECLLRYYVQATERVSETEAREALQTLPDGEPLMQTFIDKYVQQGLQQGEANILIRQLKTKFGIVPGETMARIEQADADTLLHWSERILTAEKPEDLFH